MFDAVVMELFLIIYIMQMICVFVISKWVHGLNELLSISGTYASSEHDIVFNECVFVS